MGLSVVEICAGAGGQALGLELAGFDHALAVEYDDVAVATLRQNRPGWNIAAGDVTQDTVWCPEDYHGVDLLAGGVPCPPFSVAGKQLGASDERDLLAWAVELVGRVKPRALLLENVRGLSMPRFSAYRQHVHDRLAELGYWSDWRVLEARDFGVPQLRPRFVLVAFREADAGWFEWPEPQRFSGTIGRFLLPQMAENVWVGATRWAEGANGLSPTIVGGSKKHGGADLGPSRARAAWAALGVSGNSLANHAPLADYPADHVPKLTIEMIARIQGWQPETEFAWSFTGRKTAQYRQIGNAFPPPVARAIGREIATALDHRGNRKSRGGERPTSIQDPVFAALRASSSSLTKAEIMRLIGENMSIEKFDNHMNKLARDFAIESHGVGDQREYSLRSMRGLHAAPDTLSRVATRRNIPTSLAQFTKAAVEVLGVAKPGTERIASFRECESVAEVFGEPKPGCKPGRLPKGNAGSRARGEFPPQGAIGCVGFCWKGHCHRLP